MSGFVEGIGREYRALHGAYSTFDGDPYRRSLPCGPLAEQARTEMGVETLDAVADRGYYASEEIRACEEAGITVTLPKPMTSNSKGRGASARKILSISRLTMSIFVPPVSV